MSALLRHLVFALTLFAGVWVNASERIPPVPEKYFNDYTGTVSATTASTLNHQLEQFERDTSNQLLVVVYPKMESDSSIEDYTIRVAQSWHAGQKGKNNGAVLFVFKNDRKLRIEVGYGLEPTLTDATCHDIIESILKPRFRQGNFDQGLSEAASAMIAATKGEYHGTGRTKNESSHSTSLIPWLFIAFLVFLFIVNLVIKARNPSVFMNPSRRTNTWWDVSGDSGGSIWGGGGSSDSSGGFSSGGGDFGGGGSSGSW